MKETLSEKQTYQSTLRSLFRLWTISVSKQLISVKKEKSLLYIYHFTFENTNFYNKQNTKLIQKKMKSREKYHWLKRYFCEMNLFIDKFIVIW